LPDYWFDAAAMPLFAMRGAVITQRYFAMSDAAQILFCEKELRHEPMLCLCAL